MLAWWRTCTALLWAWLACPQSDFAGVFGFVAPIPSVLLRLFVGALLPLGPWPRSSSPVKLCGKFVEGMGGDGKDETFT